MRGSHSFSCYSYSGSIDQLIETKQCGVHYVPVSDISYLRDAFFAHRVVALIVVVVVVVVIVVVVQRRLAQVLGGLGEVGQTLLGSFRLTRTAAGR